MWNKNQVTKKAELLKIFHQQYTLAGILGLLPVILATLLAEFRRTVVVRGQSRQTVLETPSPK
jgi:hypothetical protein